MGRPNLSLSFHIYLEYLFLYSHVLHTLASSNLFPLSFSSYQKRLDFSQNRAGFINLSNLCEPKASGKIEIGVSCHVFSFHKKGSLCAPTGNNR